MRVPACSDSRHDKVKAKGFSSSIKQVFNYLNLANAVFDVLMLVIGEKQYYLFFKIYFFFQYLNIYFTFFNISFSNISFWQDLAKTLQNVVDIGERCRIKVDPPTYSLINARTTENILARFFQGKR